MLWIDRIEKVGRLVLWLALSSACVIAPISYIRARSAEAERQAVAQATERADAQAKEKEAAAAALAAKADLRLSLDSMGPYMTALSASTASGSVWFTNATSRKGVVCVTGVAENQAWHTRSTSLAACVEVAAFASAVHLPLMFAGADLKGTCPTQADCLLTIKDVP